MCGICGACHWPDEVPLRTMLGRMVHRGPDDEGTFSEHGITLGMRRLSIIDLAGGSQPVVNEDATVRVVFNGEIYNYRELREELRAKGHCFSTDSDTEAIVHLYEQEGEECFRRLRGMFAIALWDARESKLILARDKFGIKPLFYARRGAGIAFASELAALREALGPVTVRPSAIAEYLTFLYIPGPDTIYEGVKQLMPGEMLRILSSGVTLRRYFDIRELVARGTRLSRREAGEMFRDILKDTVRAHLVSDVPLGLFLSGGLDSGSVLAMMRSVTNAPIKTFSIGYAEEADRGFNETGAARQMAQRFGADHTEELLRPDIAALLHTIAARMQEPFADASMIPTYLVSQVARRSVTVALSGVGGDELFGGYPRYLGMQTAALYQRIPRFLRELAAAGVAPLLPEPGSHRDYLGRLKRFASAGSLPLADQYLRWITYLPACRESNTFTADFNASTNQLTSTTRHRVQFSSWPSSAPADRAMALDLQTYLPDDLLRMGDRMSMAHSLELRVPFCDEKLLEFAVNLPVADRLRGMRPKSFMRRALEPALPKEITGAPKRGFMVPLTRWLREDLREMTGDLLSESSIRRRGYVEPAYVQWLLREHGSGRRNFSDPIFALLVLETWLRGQDSGSAA